MEGLVKRVLPHRYPFLLVDAFVAQEGDSFECLKNVSHNEPHFVGHFPDEPVMPGVLIIEALAQAAAIGLAVREGDVGGVLDAGGETDTDANGEGRAATRRSGYLAGIERARFRRKVVPGDQLRLTGTILRFRRNLCTVEAVALVGDQVAAEATLSFVFTA